MAVPNTLSIQGVRLSDEFVADARPKNWREGVLLLFPNGRAPLFGLTSGMRTRVTDDPEFNWWEKEMPNQRIQYSTNINGTDATGDGITITCASPGDFYKAGFRMNTVVRVEETNELMLVITNPTSSGSTIDMSRGWAGTTVTASNAATSGVNFYMHAVGNANEENSDAPGAVSFDPTKRTNYTQIFRDTYAMSRTAMKTRLRTGEAVREAKRETLETHSAGIEKTMFLGAKQEDSINGEIARTTDGIYNFVNTNESANIVDVDADYSGTLTLLALETILEQIFRYGSEEKMAFLGNRAMLTIQRAIRLGTNVAYNMEQGQTAFGMNVMRLVSPFGVLTLKTHPLFNQLIGGTNTTPFYGLDSWMFCLDMNELIWRPLKDSDTKFQPVLQDNGLDGMKSGYLTEGGLEIHHPKSHVVVQNIHTAGAG
jgi:hypothetical protein